MLNDKIKALQVEIKALRQKETEIVSKINLGSETMKKQEIRALDDARIAANQARKKAQKKLATIGGVVKSLTKKKGALALLEEALSS